MPYLFSNFCASLLLARKFFSIFSLTWTSIIRLGVRLRRIMVTFQSLLLAWAFYLDLAAASSLILMIMFLSSRVDVSYCVVLYPLRIFYVQIIPHPRLFFLILLEQKRLQHKTSLGPSVGQRCYGPLLCGCRISAGKRLASIYGVRWKVVSNTKG